LNDIVAEDIGHQLQGVGLNLAENLLLLITVGCLQFLLDKPGAVLITTEFYNMIVDVLEKLANSPTQGKTCETNL
jgi:hypothetical protein